MALTKRQREVYDWIAGFVQKNGYSPSFEEIGVGTGLSSLATVHKHLTNLERKGMIKRDYNRSRSIDVIPPNGRMKREMAISASGVVPLLGLIAAGKPIEALENPATISMNDVTRSKEVFALRVVGDSMRDEFIMDGDFVMVERMRTANNGEIVVALVDGTDATLKRMYRDGDRIRSEYLKYTFSDSEVLELSKTLAKHNQDLQEIEGQKKRVTADFGAKIQTEESHIGELSRKVCSGYEFRNIDCEVTYHDPTLGKKTIVRLDTGEVVKTELMSHSELQEQLPFIAGSEGEQPSA